MANLDLAAQITSARQSASTPHPVAQEIAFYRQNNAVAPASYGQSSAVDDASKMQTYAPAQMHLNPFEHMVGTLGDFGLSVARAPGRAALSLGISGHAPAGSEDVMKQLQAMNYKDRQDLLNQRGKYKTNGLGIVLKKSGFNIADPSDQEIAKFIPRSKKAQSDAQTFTPHNEVEKILLGSTPVQSVEKRNAGLKEELAKRGLPASASPLLVAGGTALDLAPLGAGDVASRVGKRLAAETVAKVAGKEVTPELIGKVAPYINPIDTLTKEIASRGGQAAKTVISKIPGSEAAGQAIVKGKDAAVTKLVESMHPVFKAIRQSETAGKVAAGSVNLLDRLRGDTAGSARQAKHFIDNDPHVQTFLKSVASLNPGNVKQAQHDFDRYAIAMREVGLVQAGKKKGAAAAEDRVARFMDEAKSLRQQYGDKIEEARQHLIKANGKVSKMLEGSSLSAQDLEHFKATDPEYYRIQREVDDFRKNGPYAKGGTSSDRAHQKVNAYAKQQALSPSATLMDTVFNAHAFINSNKLKQETVKLLQEGGHNVKALRTTANVTTRREIMASLKQSRPLRSQLERMVKKHGKASRRLQAEVDKLNKQGMEAYLKRGAKEEANTPILSGVREKLKGANRVTNPMRDVPTLSGTVASRQFTRSATSKETRDLVHSLVAVEPDKLAAIKRKLATRDPKLAQAISDLESYRTQLGQLSEQRSQAFLKARGASDTPAHGAPTISYWENGVKNTFKVDEPIARAINHYDANQIKGFGQAVRALNNAFKYGTTQGNPAFAIPNFIRDQMSSSVVSESIWRTHNPVVMAQAVSAAVRSATGRDVKDPLWDDFAKHIGGSNFVDVNKDLKKAVENVHGALNATNSPLNKIKNITVKDSALTPFRKTDDFINALENATRFQNYKGTFSLYKSKVNPATGVKYTDKEAKDAALLAARRNSVDFSAGGDFGKAANVFVPYLNAAIQGTRTLGRAIKERPATTSAKLVLASSPAAALTYWNMADPQRAKMYAETPEYIRQNNFVFIVGDKRFLIPMSQEIQPVANVMRTMMEARAGFDMKSFSTQAKDFVQGYSPFGQSKIPGGQILPPILKSSLELGVNKSFYSGQAIVPDYLKAENLNPRDQKYATTGGTSQHIANALGVSPIQVDYFLKSNFGELGGPVATNTADTLSGQQKGGRNIGKSITRRFGVDSTVNDVKSQFNNIYYPLQQTHDFKRRQINSAIYGGNEAKARRAADEWNATVDQKFRDYYKQYGQYADPSYADRIGNLKINIGTSKKGTPYISR